MTISATWTRVTATQQLQRSSHNASVVGSTVYVFGGELKPREPRDNELHKIDIGEQGSTVQSIKAPSTSPSPRVGAGTTTVGGKVYLFSGRGGVAMAPVDEKGALWTLDTSSNTWTLIEPASATYPEARSYHCMTSDGSQKIYVHAGCPEKGRRGDLWAFDLSSKKWEERTSAPDPPRGGTSIAFAGGKLYRMNGFDGSHEVGGAIDVYDPEGDIWSSIKYDADGKQGPGARSVAALLPVEVNGETLLVTLFGESDPSSLGHQGAGKMLSDVWAYSLKSGTWSQVVPEGKETPDARGWFDADVVTVDGKDSIAVVGGLGESNERLDDLWVLSF